MRYQLKDNFTGRIIFVTNNYKVAKRAKRAALVPATIEERRPH